MKFYVRLFIAAFVSGDSKGAMFTALKNHDTGSAVFFACGAVICAWIFYRWIPTKTAPDEHATDFDRMA